MIIDSHCHVWPDHIAAQVLAGKPAGLDPMGDGTIGGLLNTMDSAGIDYSCALGVATVAKNVHKTNEFIGQLDRTRFIPFGSIHQDLSVKDNLNSVRDSGLMGVKLHPNFQGLDLADPHVIEICRGLADMGIVVITHAGTGSDQSASERGSPTKVVALSRAIPELTLMACHYGGYHQLDQAEDEVVGSSVILETSWPPSMTDLDANRIRDLIRRHGTDRVVYGSDWPMANPAVEINGIRSIGLTPSECDDILGNNLARILKIAA